MIYFIKCSATFPVLNNIYREVSRMNLLWLLLLPHSLFSPACIWSHFEVCLRSLTCNTKAAGGLSSRLRTSPELLQWKLLLGPGYLIGSYKYSLASWQKTRLFLLSGEPTPVYLSTSKHFKIPHRYDHKDFPLFHWQKLWAFLVTLLMAKLGGQSLKTAARIKVFFLSTIFLWPLQSSSGSLRV